MNMRRFVSILSTAALVVVVSACSSQEKDKSKHQAPENITESLKPDAPASPLAADQGVIRLRKTSLGKAFLMSPTMVIATNAPILDTLQPLVVSFERSGDQLALFEMNLKSFYGDLPSNHLLQTFTVLKETDDEILFKWSYGLEFLSQRQNGYMTDGPAGEQDQEINRTDETVYPAVTSFVRKLEIADNSLYIEQVSRLRNSTFSLSAPALQQGQPVEINSNDITVQLNVRIRPYIPSKTFRAKESELLKGIGFFEQYSWSREEQRKIIQSMRWDLDPSRGPLVYALTKNTPPEYVEAVRDGILYWNHVLGREAIKVETGADPREPMRDRRVLVHWIDWPDAGFARAALQADPFTGELIGGNVYMTSVFALGGEITARQEARREARPVRTVTAAGFRSSSACLQPLHLPQDAFPSGSAPDAAVVQRFAQDLVRSTVAHEVGHTMGLRHNFAGNLASQVKDWAEQRRLEKEYLANGLNDGFVTASTVMDYSLNLDTAIMGSFIRTKALSYDRKAMEWGYLNLSASAVSLGAPPFCTDYQVGEGLPVVGCERFDNGVHPLVAKSELIQVGRENMVMRFARNLIIEMRPRIATRAKTPAQLRELVNGMKLSSRISRVFSSSENLKESLLQGTVHWLTRTELGDSGLLNESAWKARNLELMKGEWAAVGGLSSVIQKTLPFENGSLSKGWLVRQAQKALENPELQSGITLEGVKYELNAEEKSTLADLLLKFADLAEDAYLETAFEKVSFSAGESVNGKPARVEASFLPTGDEEHVGALAAGVILPSDETVKVGVGEATVEVPVARHSADVRTAALRWLAPKIFGRPSWTSAAREQIRVELIRRLTLLGAKGEDSLTLKISLAGLNLKDDATAWAADEISVLSALEKLANE